MSKQVCKVTGQEFTVGEDEQEFYEQFKLPVPELSPDERLRRKLAFVNEHRFFWRKCSLSGDRVFSVYPARAPFPVYSVDLWRSDAWDPLSYGAAFNSRAPFFEQLLEMWTKVPRPSVSSFGCTGSMAVQYAYNLKNCYLVTSSVRTDDSLYSSGLVDCRNCCDCYFCIDCERCYECTNLVDCSNLRWSSDCLDCRDSAFLSGCSGCRDCLFCANLQGKRFCFMNQQLTEEDYRLELEKWRISVRPVLETAIERYAEFLKSQPVPHGWFFTEDAVPNLSGNFLHKSSNALESYECYDAKDVFRCVRLSRARRCIDALGFGETVRDSAQFVMCGLGADWLINCIECFGEVSDLIYCAYCEGSRNLFGCIGLRGREFCIFNRQRTESEYRTELEQILDHLEKKKVLGKFFPAAFSGFAYNHAVAADYMPLNKYQAEMLNFGWDDQGEELKPSQLLGQDGESSDRFADTPLTLDEVNSEDAGRALYICEMSGRPYQITQRELEFYKSQGIAPPARCFEQRHTERAHKAGPRKLRALPGGEIQTSFPADWFRPIISRNEYLRTLRQS